MLMILSILLPLAGALAAFRMQDDLARHRTTAVFVIASALLASLVSKSYIVVLLKVLFVVSPR